jgi:mono/diheme cytochrome c family protein
MPWRKTSQMKRGPVALLSQNVPAPKLAIVLAALAISLGGCRSDMQNQPKMLPLRHTLFFGDGRSGREQVRGTVARAQVDRDSYFMTGMQDGMEGNTLPFEINYAALRRGQEQFNIYCSPCHSRVGNGKGAVVARGYLSAADMQSVRLQSVSLGHIFNVITHGNGAMPSYASQISPVNRWAIVAYIRALQLSQNASFSDVPTGVRVMTVRTLLQRSTRPEHFLDIWDVSAHDAQEAGISPDSTAEIAKGRVENSENRAGLPDKNMKGSLQPDNAASTSAGALVQTDAAAQAKPPEKGDAAHGNEIYLANCSVCHQPNLSGIPPQFPSLVGIVDRVGEGKIRRVAKEGIPDGSPPMPPHPDLSEKDLNDLVEFLRGK